MGGGKGCFWEGAVNNDNYLKSAETKNFKADVENYLY